MKIRLSDDNYNKLGELVEWLHNLADQLTGVSPSTRSTCLQSKFRSWNWNWKGPRAPLSLTSRDTTLREQKKKNRKGKYFTKLVKTYANYSL